MAHKSRKYRRKRSQPYTEGEMNKLADSLIHPFYRRSQSYRLLDALVHAAIERDPQASLKKSVKYNSSEIVEKLLKLISQRKK